MFSGRMELPSQGKHGDGLALAHKPGPEIVGRSSGIQPGQIHRQRWSFQHVEKSNAFPGKE